MAGVCPLVQRDRIFDLHHFERKVRSECSQCDQIWRNFSKILNCFGNFKSFISIWQNLEPTLTQIFMLGIVCISIVVDCQILKSHLAIRSHWMHFTFCTKPLLQYRTNFVLPKWSLNDHYFKICILWVQVKAWPRVMRSNLFGHSLSLSLSLKFGHKLTRWHGKKCPH